MFCPDPWKQSGMGKDHDVLSVQKNGSFGWFIDARYQVEYGSLTCPVRTNKATDLSWFYLQVVIVNSTQSSEIMPHFFD